MDGDVRKTRRQSSAAASLIGAQERAGGGLVGRVAGAELNQAVAEVDFPRVLAWDQPGAVRPPYRHTFEQRVSTGLMPPRDNAYHRPGPGGLLRPQDHQGAARVRARPEDRREVRVTPGSPGSGIPGTPAR